MDLLLQLAVLTVLRRFVDILKEFSSIFNSFY